MEIECNAAWVVELARHNHQHLPDARVNFTFVKLGLACNPAQIQVRDWGVAFDVGGVDFDIVAVGKTLREDKDGDRLGVVYFVQCEGAEAENRNPL